MKARVFESFNGRVVTFIGPNKREDVSLEAALNDWLAENPKRKVLSIAQSESSVHAPGPGSEVWRYITMSVLYEEMG